MKIIIMAFALFSSSSVFADSSKTLICLMGDIANMDITISSFDDKRETVEVSLTGMNDEIPARVYQNSHFIEYSISKSLSEGIFEAILSKSDLAAIFGGAFLDAGVLSMTKSKEIGRYDVIFSAEDIVYTANCGE